MNVYGASLDFGIELPNAQKEVLTGLHPTLTLKEKMKQLELGHSKGNLHTANAHGMVFLVNGDVAYDNSP